MNKAELVKEITKKTELRKCDVEAVIKATTETITEELSKGGNVQLIGFGTFETRQRKARQGRNPRKPDELINIPAATAPAFKAGKALKDAVNK